MVSARNEEMLADHYKDSRLGKLSKHTINLFCSVSKDRKINGVSVADQNRNDIDVRTRVMKSAPGEWVIAPQHIWVDPDGKILSSVPYLVTKAQLEWTWVQAIQKFDPSFEWKLPEAAHAPKRLRLDGKATRGSKEDQPPKPEEVEKALEEIRKSRRGWRKARENFDMILRSDNPKAIALAEQFMRSSGVDRKLMTIRNIGRRSPKPWAEIVEPYLSDKEPELRRAAAQALGEIGNPKSKKALSKAMKSRKEDSSVRGAAMQALSKLDPGDRTLGREIAKALGPKSDETLRLHAVQSAARLEKRKDVEAYLGQALSDSSELVRKTAILMIAERRDAALLAAIKTAMQNEKSEECKQLAAAAEKAIAGGDLKAFAALRKQLDDK